MTLLAWVALVAPFLMLAGVFWRGGQTDQKLDALVKKVDDMHPLVAKIPVIETKLAPLEKTVERINSDWPRLTSVVAVLETKVLSLKDQRAVRGTQYQNIPGRKEK